ncbi:MAG: hypothetical protein AB1515_02180 [Nitrospirota bacterium]
MNFHEQHIKGLKIEKPGDQTDDKGDHGLRIHEACPLITISELTLPNRSMLNDRAEPVKEPDGQNAHGDIHDGAGIPLQIFHRQSTPCERRSDFPDKLV